MIDAHEADDVTGDTARKGDDEILRPLLKWEIPREEGEVGLVDGHRHSHR